MDLPSFLSDNNNLERHRDYWMINDPLAKPGVKTFVYLSLKVPRNCPVWEVYWLVGAIGSSMG